jgi:hypothetical protein
MAKFYSDRIECAHIKSEAEIYDSTLFDYSIYYESIKLYTKNINFKLLKCSKITLIDISDLTLDFSNSTILLLNCKNIEIINKNNNVTINNSIIRPCNLFIKFIKCDVDVSQFPNAFYFGNCNIFASRPCKLINTQTYENCTINFNNITCRKVYIYNSNDFVLGSCEEIYLDNCKNFKFKSDANIELLYIHSMDVDFDIINVSVLDIKNSSINMKKLHNIKHLKIERSTFYNYSKNKIDSVCITSSRVNCKINCGKITITDIHSIDLSLVKDCELINLRNIMKVCSTKLITTKIKVKYCNVKPKNILFSTKNNIRTYNYFLDTNILGNNRLRTTWGGVVNILVA